MKNPTEWQPRTSTAVLRARARLYGAIRHYFEARQVLEIETPILSAAATVDPNIDSFSSREPGGRQWWLQTSPEFAMKRLLAAGSGPIYQIARVFRREEAGRHHNPEFSMLEWYRPGWDHRALMDEVEALLRAAGVPGGPVWERLTYGEAFLRHAGLDPFAASLEQLRQTCTRNLNLSGALLQTQDRDVYLDLLMSGVVGPRLGPEAPAFLYDFPASQAALARVRPGEPPLAERFELFWQGIELANGFHELTDAAEQRRRFEQDRARRMAEGREAPPYDARMVAALEAGLPDCAGVALGLDRLLMLMLDLPALGDTLAFDAERA
ncbi:MAG TPA: EF-P lysine aminoacylase EpmA [Nevskia sp.]|nr:EF-P lysine aminoacylase EpmA [Nevskia sp.]